MAISAKMLQYRGAYENFRPSVLLPGQFAVVLSGDPNTTTGKAVYMCFETGKATRILADGDVVSGGGVSDAQIAQAVENYLANNPINIPVANENTLGGVKPVAKTSSMTQPVGADANGALFTTPGGSDVDLGEYYKKTETYSKDEIDAKFANIESYPDAEGVAF